MESNNEDKKQSASHTPDESCEVSSCETGISNLMSTSKEESQRRIQDQAYRVREIFDDPKTSQRKVAIAAGSQRSAFFPHFGFATSSAFGTEREVLVGTHVAGSSSVGTTSEKNKDEEEGSAKRQKHDHHESLSSDTVFETTFLNDPQSLSPQQSTSTKLRTIAPDKRSLQPSSTMVSSGSFNLKGFGVSDRSTKTFFGEKQAERRPADKEKFFEEVGQKETGGLLSPPMIQREHTGSMYLPAQGAGSSNIGTQRGIRPALTTGSFALGARKSNNLESVISPPSVRRLHESTSVMSQPALPSYSPYPRFKLNNNDVICDFSGTIMDDSVGNRRFSVLLDLHQESYRNATSTVHRYGIATKILNTMKEALPPGKVVQVNQATGIIHIVKDEVAIRIIERALAQKAGNKPAG